MALVSNCKVHIFIRSPQSQADDKQQKTQLLSCFWYKFEFYSSSCCLW